jgi:hypothetical protein
VSGKWERAEGKIDIRTDRVSYYSLVFSKIVFPCNRDGKEEQV